MTSFPGENLMKSRLWFFIRIHISYAFGVCIYQIPVLQPHRSNLSWIWQWFFSSSRPLQRRQHKPVCDRKILTHGGHRTTAQCHHHAIISYRTWNTSFKQWIFLFFSSLVVYTVNTRRVNTMLVFDVSFWIWQFLQHKNLSFVCTCK